ncbi:MAG: zinc dependent phospholipase C family protein [Ferruginibacter sp.]
MKTVFKSVLISLCFLVSFLHSYCWGFYAHQKINYYAVFLLPPEMLVLYKPNISFLTEHATDPDKRRYVVKAEGPRHFIDIDHYGQYPYPNLPHKWKDAVAKFGEDSLNKYGIVPWYVPVMLYRLTNAFKQKNFSNIMRYSAEIGHYIADAHVPLHTNSNHDGQLTNQKGIHAFWESRIPELLAEKEFNFFIGKAGYIENPEEYIWARVLESAQEADSVLLIERDLIKSFSPDKIYSFEQRNGKVIRQYSADFTIAYNNKLNGMVERRMRQAIYSVASFWYTAWVNAGQPDLKELSKQKFTDTDIHDFEELNKQWQTGSKMIGRQED